MLHQISLAWSNIKSNGGTIGLLSLDNWRGVNLFGVTKTNSDRVHQESSGDGLLFKRRVSPFGEFLQLVKYA